MLDHNTPLYLLQQAPAYIRGKIFGDFWWNKKIFPAEVFTCFAKKKFLVTFSGT